MNLRDLLRRAEPLGEPPSVEITGLDYDSRRIGPGDLFFPFEGEVVDGHRFTAAARQAGAAAVASERPRPSEDSGVWVQVEHGRRALAAAALDFYERPDRKLALTAVTGTNGKTTTVYLIDAIFGAAGRTTGLFGTIEHRVGERSIPALNTTPESLDLARFMAELLGIGGTHAALEASSHALALSRLWGFELQAAVFTNLSQDHLDFHGDMASYAAAKRMLFEGAGVRPPRWGVVNIDDTVGRALLEMEGFEKLSFGRSQRAQVRAENLRSDFSGLRFTAKTPFGDIAVRSGLLGDFNVMNILAAAGAALANGIEIETIERGVAQCAAVPGRFETVDEGQAFLVVVDYAHTDDALRNLIASARALQTKPGRLITLFGCGGDRDRGKRAAMGEVAGLGSDHVILTSDNPRTEDPLRILADAEEGLRRSGTNYEIVADRRAAIREALFKAGEGDIVLIAGKGHETYQVIGRERTHFDDRETARKMLQELGYRSERA